MPMQLITGTDCCPCACPLTVNLTQNITNVQGAQSTISNVNPTVLGTEHSGDLWINQLTGAFWYFNGTTWIEEIA